MPAYIYIYIHSTGASPALWPNSGQFGLPSPSQGDQYKSTAIARLLFGALLRLFTQDASTLTGAARSGGVHCTKFFLLAKLSTRSRWLSHGFLHINLRGKRFGKFILKRLVKQAQLSNTSFGIVKLIKLRGSWPSELHLYIRLHTRRFRMPRSATKLGWCDFTVCCPPGTILRTHILCLKKFLHWMWRERHFLNGPGKHREAISPGGPKFPRTLTHLPSGITPLATGERSVDLHSG